MSITTPTPAAAPPVAVAGHEEAVTGGAGGAPKE